MTIVRCPTCDKPFDTEKTAAMPFCSERCRLVDLRRWLKEEYGLPVERDDERDNASPPEVTE